MARKISAVLTNTTGQAWEAQAGGVTLSLVQSTSRSVATGVYDPPYATIYLTKAQTGYLLQEKELGDSIRVAFEAVPSSDGMARIRVCGRR